MVFTSSETRKRAREIMGKLSDQLGISEEMANMSISRDMVFDIQWININQQINKAIVEGNLKAYVRLVDRRDVIILSKIKLPDSYWEEREQIAMMYDSLIAEAQRKGNTFMMEMYLYEKYKQIELLQDEYIREIYPLEVDLKEVSFGD